MIGGNRFLGHELALRLVAAGARVTLFNRGTLADTLGGRVESLRGDRTSGDLERARWAAAASTRSVDFAAFDGDDGRRAAALFDGQVGHYVVISTGQVYLVREGCPRPAREADYDGPLLDEPQAAFDRGQWEYGVKKRALEDELAGRMGEAALPGHAPAHPDGERRARPLPTDRAATCGGCSTAGRSCCRAAARA